MSWTAEQHRIIANAILGAWPTTSQTMGASGIAAYVSALERRGLDAADTLRAIDTWPAGSDFPPSAPNLAAAAMRDPSAPVWEEAEQIIFAFVLKARTAVRKSSWEFGERDQLNREAMVERAATVHPLVQAFIVAQSLDRLRRLDLDDENYGEARRQRLREAWEQFCEAHQGREVAALAAGRRGDLAAFDPLTALKRAGFDGPPRQLNSGNGA